MSWPSHEEMEARYLHALQQEQIVTERCANCDWCWEGKLAHAPIVFRGHLEQHHRELLPVMDAQRRAPRRSIVPTAPPDFGLLRRLDLLAAAQMPTFLKGEVSSLAVRLDRLEMELKQERILAEALIDSGEETTHRTFGSRAGDERAMRGVPILGRGVGGRIGDGPAAPLPRRSLDRMLRKAAQVLDVIFCGLRDVFARSAAGFSDRLGKF